MPSLFVRPLGDAVPLEDGFEVRVEWLLRESDGSVRGSGVTDFWGLKDLADPNQDWVTVPANVVVLFPNEHVLNVSATVPGRSAAQIRRALPYAVEEFIATDIDQMHLASGAIRSGQPVACQLIDRNFLSAWLDALRAAGVQPGYCVADAQVLPIDADTAAVLLDEEVALLRTPEQAATIDRDNLVLALGTVDVSTVVVYNDALTDIEAAQLEHASVETAESGHSALETLARLWAPNPDLNLMQGDYAPPRVKSAGARGWGIAAGLLAVWIGVAWLGMIAEAWWADRQAQTLTDEANALYTDLFPGERPRNPRRALASKLGQAPVGEGRGFVALTGDIAAVLPSDARMRALEFAGDKGELKSEILMGGFSELEQFEQALESRGVEAELQNSLQEDDSVRAYFLLRAQP